MKIRAFVIGLLCCEFAIASGCAVQGASFQKAQYPPTSAAIYVYRPYSYASSLLRPAVICGGQSAEIGPGGYHAYIVPAGKVTCEVAGSESKDKVEILAEPGSYYIKEDFSWGVLRGHPHLNPVDSDTARDEIKSCVLEQ